MGTTTIDYYAVLGVPANASGDAIKKAFRGLARELHPDYNSDPVASERFKTVNTAYGVLSDPSARAEYDDNRRVLRWDDLFGTPRDPFYGNEPLPIPDPEDRIMDGVRVHVEFTRSFYGSIYEHYVIELDDIRRICQGGPHQYPSFARALGVNFHIMHKGVLVEVVQYLSFTRLQQWLSRYDQKLNRRKQLAELRTRLDALRVRMRQLHQSGKPVSSAGSLLAMASVTLGSAEDPFVFSPVAIKTVIDAILTFEHELDRIEQAGITHLFIEEVTAGRLFAGVHERNLVAMRQIVEFNVRTGGKYGNDVNELDLWHLYYQTISQVSSIDQINPDDLVIQLDDRVLPDEAFEIDEIAPRSIKLEGNKGKIREFEMEYSREFPEDGGSPTGSITIPLAVFEKYAAEYGKKSKFPDLGFGIRLHVVVKLDSAGKIYVGGWADDIDLVKRVEKRQKGLNRLPDGSYYDPNSTGPPSWARGQAARNRRR